jgi:hypothetical protein
MADPVVRPPPPAFHAGRKALEEPMRPLAERAARHPGGGRQQGIHGTKAIFTAQ